MLIPPIASELFTSFRIPIILNRDLGVLVILLITILLYSYVTSLFSVVSEIIPVIFL